MKILIFWEQDYYGGVDTHLYELLRTWPNKKDQITILTNQENGAVKKFEESLKIFPNNLKIKKFNSFSYNIINFKLKKIKILQYLLYFFIPLLFLINLKLLYKLISNFKDYEVILSNNGGYPASWNCISSIIVAKKIGIPKRFLLIHHESSNFFPFMKWFHKIIDRLVSKSVTNIICVSKATKNSILKKRFLFVPAKKFKIIYNSLEIQKTSKQNNYSRLRKIYKISPKKILIGVISRIEPYKGHKELLNSISKIDKMYLDKIHFLFIGKGYGKYENLLKNLTIKLNLQKTVTFTGFIKGKSETIISELDLLINPTQTFEGFGLSILEAINCRTPVIATNVGAVKEVFGKKNINLVPAQSSKAMSEQIILFIKKPKFFLNKANFAYKLFSRKYSPMSKEYRNSLLSK
mgnify:CR=1 FL=1|tara:strand:- start:2349 stop:3569 length:1221 start_codon:yes stop_codon:yes gene_type:complete